MRRDVTVEVSSRDFYRTGLYPDVVQVRLGFDLGFGLDLEFGLDLVNRMTITYSI